MVPRGLEPRTLRLLAVRSNQLSYETTGNRYLYYFLTMVDALINRFIFRQLAISDPGLRWPDERIH